VHLMTRSLDLVDPLTGTTAFQDKNLEAILQGDVPSSKTIAQLAEAKRVVSERTSVKAIKGFDASKVGKLASVGIHTTFELAIADLETIAKAFYPGKSISVMRQREIGLLKRYIALGEKELQLSLLKDARHVQSVLEEGELRRRHHFALLDKHPEMKVRTDQNIPRFPSYSDKAYGGHVWYEQVIHALLKQTSASFKETESP